MTFAISEVIIVVMIILIVASARPKLTKAMGIVAFVMLGFMALSALLYVTRTVSRTQTAPTSIAIPTGVVRRVESRNGRPHYQIINQLQAERMLEIQQLNRNFVPNIHTDRVSAAESLARQLVGRLRAQKQTHVPTTLAVNHDGLRNAGQTATETNELVSTFRRSLESGLKNTKIQVTEYGDTNAANVVIDHSHTSDATTLRLNLNLDGNPYHITAKVAEKPWLRRGAIDDDGEQFVVFGAMDPVHGNYSHTSAVSRAAERLVPVLASRWDELRTSDWDFQKVSHSIEDVSRFVAQKAVVDELPQSFEKTIAGAVLTKPDRRKFLLVDYSPENLARAIRATEAEWKTDAPDRVETSSHRTRHAKQHAQVGSMSSLASVVLLACGIAVIYSVSERFAQWYDETKSSDSPRE